MKYARIKKDFTSIIAKSNKRQTFIKGELYTIKEIQKLIEQGYLSFDDFEYVDIPKNNTGFFFGARIELKKPGA